MTEYRVSGFRWDSVICIRKGGQQCWSDDDDNENGVLLLQESTSLIRKLGGFSVAEDLQNDAIVTNPVSAGGIGFDAQWSDTSYYQFHDCLGSTNDNGRSMAEFHQAVSASYPGGG